MKKKITVKIIDKVGDEYTIEYDDKCSLNLCTPLIISGVFALLVGILVFLALFFCDSKMHILLKIACGLIATIISFVIPAIVCNLFAKLQLMEEIINKSEFEQKDTVEPICNALAEL